MTKAILLALVVVLSIITAGCSSPKGAATDNSSIREAVIEDEILVQLRSEESLATLLQQYSVYRLEMIERLHPYHATYLLGFKAERIDPDTILEKLRQEPAVVQVSFNLKTEKRTR